MKNNKPQPRKQKTTATRNAGRLALLLLLLFLLAACDGNTEPESTAEVAAAPSPTAEVEAPPTEAAQPPAAEPTAITEDEPEPTAVPPTDEPEAPPPTDAPEPSATPEPAGLALPAGDCGNSIYPVIDGATYTYRTEVPGIGTTEQTFAFANVTDSSFDIVSSGLTDEEPVTLTWTCTPEGLLAPNLGALMGQAGVEIVSVEASGLSIPSADDFEVGYTYDSQWVVKATLDDPSIGTAQMDQVIEFSNEVVAIEPISVPAGDFPEAYKVVTNGTFTMIMSIDGEPLPEQVFDMSSTTWYVVDVGQVRSEELMSGFGLPDGGPSITELIAFER